jgi:hypothetical protein
MANMPFFGAIYRAKRRRECDRKPRAMIASGLARCAIRSAAAADILQPRIHPHVFRADRIYVFCRFGFRSGSRRLCGCGSGRSGPVVACQSGSGLRYRFAIARLGDRRLGQRANRDEHDKEFHFGPFCPEPATKCGRFRSERRLFIQIKWFAGFSQAKCPQSSAMSMVNCKAGKCAGF